MIEPKVTIKRVTRDSDEYKSLKAKGWLVHQDGQKTVEMISKNDASRRGTYLLNKALGWF